jgi:transcriptional regulator with XRE-family HTH domain
MTALGRQLRAARHAIGYSLRDTSAITGLSPAEISRVENGHRIPRLRTLEELARAHDLEIVIGPRGARVIRREER